MEKEFDENDIFYINKPFTKEELEWIKGDQINGIKKEAITKKLKPPLKTTT